MGKVSVFTEVIQNVAREGHALREIAAKSRAVPLGQERLSHRDAVTRVTHMTPADLLAMKPEERKSLLKEVGTTAVLEVIRRRRP